MPPTIAGGDDEPNEKKVVLSKPLTLECEARGHPPPSLTWLKDGVPVRDGESVRILEQGSRIEILSAAVSDSGRYVCVATSIAGEKEVKFDVRVLGTGTCNNNNDIPLCVFCLVMLQVRLYLSLMTASLQMHCINSLLH